MLDDIRCTLEISVCLVRICTFVPSSHRCGSDLLVQPIPTYCSNVAVYNFQL